MKTSTFCVLAAIAGLSPLLRADEPAIVAKARAYLGSESALNAVNSVHMTGNISGALDASGTSSQMAVDIIVQKPWQESITMLGKDRFVHMALDDFEASQQTQESPSANQTVIDPKKPWRLTILGPDQVRALRVDISESLWFYRGALRAGGTVEDRGAATVDGIDTEKVAFVYAPNAVYIRYFERSTGRLVFTETESGTKIRESGEIMAGGIRFPRQIAVTDTLNGKESTKTYSFDKITLNESFPAALFSVPDLPTPASFLTAPGQPPPAH